MTEKRLDRVICNEAWMDFWNVSSCYTLVRSQSDHFPLLLSSSKAIQTFPSSFKFHKMWISHPDCERLVKEVWNKSVFGCPMIVLALKLKSLKGELKVWNKSVFGNIHLRVQSAMDVVEDIQMQIDANEHQIIC